MNKKTNQEIESGEESGEISRISDTESGTQRTNSYTSGNSQINYNEDKENEREWEPQTPAWLREDEEESGEKELKTADKTGLGETQRMQNKPEMETAGIHAAVGSELQDATQKEQVHVTVHNPSTVSPTMAGSQVTSIREISNDLLGSADTSSVQMSQVDVTPLQQHVTPFQQHVSSHQQHVTPLQQHVTALQQHVTPLQHVSQLQQHVNKVQKENERLNVQMPELQDPRKSTLEEYEAIIKKHKTELHELKLSMLYKAVLTGDKGTVQQLRKENFDFNSKYSGEMILHIAVRQGRCELLSELVEGGADINATNSQGETALHITIRHKRFSKVVDKLLTLGIDWHSPDAKGWTPMQLAAAMGEIGALEIFAKNDYNCLSLAVDREESTLLHYAAANKQKDLAKWLVKQGLTRENEDQRGYKAKHYARMAGDKELARWLGKRYRKISLKICCISSKKEMDKEALQRLRIPSETDLSSFSTHQTSSASPHVSRDNMTNTTDIVNSSTEMLINTPDTLKSSSSSAGTKVAKAETNRLHSQKKRAPSRQPPRQSNVHLQELPRENGPAVEVANPTTELTRVGLPNLGNTCYMNSVLQCLYHTHPLTRHIMAPSNGMVNGRVAGAYKTIIEAMSSDKKTNNLLLTMKEVAASRDTIFLDNMQKEAHDYLSLLLEWLHQDLAQEDNVKDVDDTGLSSFISEWFHGRHLSEITCPKTESVVCETEEPFSNLTLPVKPKKICDLEELINQYYRQQEIMWDCRNCNKEHLCTVKSSIVHLPRFLLLHLSRVNADTHSVQKTKVTYPLEHLSLSPYTTRQSSPYDLYAVCCHQGSMASGHYTAFCRSSSSRDSIWYSFNDTQVNKTQSHEFRSNPDAHILFYQAQAS